MKYAAVTNLTLVNPIIYGVNTEVARLEVPAHLTRSEAIGEVDNLISSASAEALARGAARFKDSVFTADLAAPSGGSSTEQRALLVAEITGNREPMAIIALSAVNAVEGTPVALIAKVKKDPLIYRKGKVIANTNFDPGLPIDAIFDQMQTFIQKDVYRRAIANGMIPVAGRQDSLLNIGPADLFPVIDEISKMQLRSNLRVIVVEDTRAADRLKVRFELR